MSIVDAVTTLGKDQSMMGFRICFVDICSGEWLNDGMSMAARV